MPSAATKVCLVRYTLCEQTACDKKGTCEMEPRIIRLSFFKLSLNKVAVFIRSKLTKQNITTGTLVSLLLPHWYLSSMRNVKEFDHKANETKVINAHLSSSHEDLKVLFASC